MHLSLSTEIFFTCEQISRVPGGQFFFFSFSFLQRRTVRLRCLERYANFGSAVGVDHQGAVIRLAISWRAVFFSPLQVRKGKRGGARFRVCVGVCEVVFSWRSLEKIAGF